jgi:hypothetical protein
MNANSHKGFEIAFNLQRKILWVRAWGDWDLDFGKRYAMAIQGKIRELSSEWKIWYVLMDVNRFSAQSEEVWSIIREQLETENTSGLKKIAYIQNGIRPQLPSNNERDGPVQSSFESTDKALRWFFE